MITNKEVRISVNKTLTRKLIYVVAALAMLAMLIPAMAVPVSAAPNQYGSLKMVLVDPITHNPQTTDDSGYDVLGSRVQVTATTAPNWVVTSWILSNVATAPGKSPATWVGGTPGSGNTTVQVQGIYGDAIIQANIQNTITSANDTLTIEKKWGPIDNTVITPPGQTLLNWNGVDNCWYGQATLTDTVNGNVWEVSSPPGVTHTLQGVILNWYLVSGDAPVSTLVPGETQALKDQVATFATPELVKFQGSSWPKIHYRQTVSDGSGQATATLIAEGPEAVKVVVIPEYPFEGGVNIPVIPEVTEHTFYITQNEIVPQVRWAGEKVVLERYYGQGNDDHWVKFTLDGQSIGALYPVSTHDEISDSAVWTQVDHDGFASVILEASDQGQATVYAGLYEQRRGQQIMSNQTFIVYFLKFESVTLGDVQGKRVGHNTGVWEIIPGGRTNPWDPTGSYNGTQNPATPDSSTQTLNVSQDALLRAQVRGWFVNRDPSYRGARLVNATDSSLIGDSPNPTMTLPATRWVLPDDWAILGGANWQQSRLHWDIMCDPYGTIYDGTSLTTGLGPYTKPGTTTRVAVSGEPVVGPFSPGIEMMTPTGWWIGTKAIDWYTVVPDGNMNTWDAPMPPAKIIYQIQSSENPLAKAGYFKWANKTDIYYKMVGTTKVYTNPFYQAMVPAHPAIPAFVESGYDWDSWDDDYGPYVFWKIMNQSTLAPLVPTSDPTNHPTNVAVYSDNHGEAMVWLNGNWNLDLTDLLDETSTADIPLGYTVGYTTVQATADYPYARGAHSAFQSNKDTKTWTWGGQVLGTDTHDFAVKASPRPSTNTNDTRMVLSVGKWSTTTEVGSGDAMAAKSSYKMVWVWVTDRDGLRNGVNGAKVTWRIGNVSGSNIIIENATGKGISNFNSITQNIYVENGFLALPDPDPLHPNSALPSGGVITDGAARMNGYSFLRAPTATEVALFNKFWGATPTANPANPYTGNATLPGGTSTIRADASKYCVAAIKVTGGENNYVSRARIDISIESHDFDISMGQTYPGVLSYETNVDLSIIDALDDGIRVGDANCDGTVNMGDVTAVERMILGYNSVTSNSVLNDDGTVDMGTVVKIERTILGLN